jgi:hypothetical protein
MYRFDYNTNTVENVDHTIREIFAQARHEFLLAPIVIRHYGGKSFGGVCVLADKDTAHERFLRAWRRAQGAGAGAEHNNGYLL